MLCALKLKLAARAVLSADAGLLVNAILRGITPFLFDNDGVVLLILSSFDCDENIKAACSMELYNVCV